MKATFVGRGLAALGLFAVTFSLTLGMIAKAHAAPLPKHCCILDDPHGLGCGGGGDLILTINGPVCQSDPDVVCYYDEDSDSCETN